MALDALAINKKGFHAVKQQRGLYVQAHPLKDGAGYSRSWVFRYVSPITKATRWMGLGSADCLSLDDASELARAARRLVALGTDPIDHRNERKAEAA
jgi:hypothetical protein